MNVHLGYGTKYFFTFSHHLFQISEKEGEENQETFER